MEPHQLPDDLNRWPRDPFALFGVEPGVGKKDLRKAYTHLIRKFKPEQFPAQFQRIRDAYEFLLDYGHMPNPFSGGLPVNMSLDDPAHRPTELHLSDVRTPREQPPQHDVKLIETTTIGPLWPTSDLEMRSFWEKACSGNEEIAYGEIRQTALQDPSQSDFLLGAYWLLVAFPKLDASRKPSDWLLKGVRVHGCNGIWRELLSREFRHDPGQALSDAISDLLHVMNSPVELVSLAEVRWMALELLGEWDALARDVDILGPRLWRDDEQAWMRLMLASCDFTAWPASMAARKLFDRSRAKIEEANHLHESFREDLSRLDYLVEVSQAWHPLGREDIPQQFLGLIPMAWTKPFAQTRIALYAVLEKIAQEPRKSLVLFDRLQTVAPSVLAQFGNLLSQLQQERQSATIPHQSNTRIAQWLPHHDGSREKLLTFCLREGVTPDEIAEYGELRKQHLEWMYQLRHDFPVQYVCKAHHLFWS